MTDRFGVELKQLDKVVFLDIANSARYIKNGVVWKVSEDKYNQLKCTIAYRSGDSILLTDVLNAENIVVVTNNAKDFDILIEALNEKVS